MLSGLLRVYSESSPLPHPFVFVQIVEGISCIFPNHEMQNCKYDAIQALEDIFRVLSPPPVNYCYLPCICPFATFAYYPSMFPCTTVTCVYGVMHVYFCGYLSLGYHHACVYFMEWGSPSRTHPSLCDSCDKYPNLVTGKEELCANNASNWIYSSGRQKA